MLIGASSISAYAKTALYTQNTGYSGQFLIDSYVTEDVGGTDTPRRKFLASTDNSANAYLSMWDSSNVQGIKLTTSGFHSYLAMNGKLGIGKTSPAHKLDVNGTAGANTFSATTVGSASAPAFTNNSDTNTGMYFPFEDTIAFSEGGYERMRIASNGAVLVATTTTGSFGAKLRVGGRIETSSGIYATSNGSSFRNGGMMGGATIETRSHTSYGTYTQKQVSFKGSSGTEYGSISIAGSATSYNTSSDERLKENIQDANDAGSKIDSIKVRQFDWKLGGEHQDYGVIAQELETVAPEAVSKGYNEEDMWSVDYSKLVPTLIKEIQSLRNRVAELENNE